MEPTDELRQLLDRQAIEDVLFRYCRGVDRGDAALIASAYHPDAIDEHGARTFAGEGIGHGIIDMTGSQRITFHSITNMTVAFHEPDQCHRTAAAGRAQAEEIADEFAHRPGRHAGGVQLCVSCCSERHQV